MSIRNHINVRGEGTGLDDPWRIQLLQEVIFTENTAPDREIWDEKGGLIKKGAAEIAERDQDRGFGGF